ncbi:hypothetical protein BH23ACT2_BH23ACT2_13220 [soil metagenome]
MFRWRPYLTSYTVTPMSTDTRTKPAAASGPCWETVDQFGNRTHLSRPTIYAMIRRGMPSITIGRARRIDPEAAMEWLRQRSDDAA